MQNDFRVRYKNKASVMTINGIQDIIKQQSLPVQYSEAQVSNGINFKPLFANKQKIQYLSSFISLQQKNEQVESMKNQKDITKSWILSNHAYPLPGEQQLANSWAISYQEQPFRKDKEDSWYLSNHIQPLPPIEELSNSWILTNHAYPLPKSQKPILSQQNNIDIVNESKEQPYISPNYSFGFNRNRSLQNPKQFKSLLQSSGEKSLQSSGLEQVQARYKSIIARADNFLQIRDAQHNYKAF